MRHAQWLVFGLTGLLSLPGLGQTLPAHPDAQKIKLDLTIEQVKIIVQALPQISCGTMAQWVVCREADLLLKEIKEQASAQAPK